MVKYNYNYKCGVFTGMEKLFMIKLQIPATSANLGAGFDALGLALTYYNFVEMEESDTIDIATLDNIDIPTDEKNLIYISGLLAISWPELVISA